MITQTIDYSTIQQLYAMLYHVMQAVDVPVPEQGVPQLRTPSTSTVDTHIGPRLSPPSKAVGVARSLCRLSRLRRQSKAFTVPKHDTAHTGDMPNTQKQ